MKLSRMLGTLAILAFALAPWIQTASRADDAKDGEGLYKTKCASCHAADGSGSTAAGKAMKVRDLRSAEVQKATDDELSQIIAKGKNKMPAYEKQLKPDQIKGLVARVRELGKKK